MTADDILTMLKVDLGITTEVYNDRLTAYIENAKAQIAREGVEATDTVDYYSLVVMYAGWTWRRRDTGEGMPRMLRYQLNNLLASQKMAGN